MEMWNSHQHPVLERSPHLSSTVLPHVILSPTSTTLSSRQPILLLFLTIYCLKKIPFKKYLMIYNLQNLVSFWWLSLSLIHRVTHTSMWILSHNWVVFIDVVKPHLLSLPVNWQIARSFPIWRYCGDTILPWISPTNCFMDMNFTRMELAKL